MLSGHVIYSFYYHRELLTWFVYGYHTMSMHLSFIYTFRGLGVDLRKFGLDFNKTFLACCTRCSLPELNKFSTNLAPQGFPWITPTPYPSGKVPRSIFTPAISTLKPFQPDTPNLEMAKRARRGFLWVRPPKLRVLKGHWRGYKLCWGLFSWVGSSVRLDSLLHFDIWWYERIETFRVTI